MTALRPQIASIFSERSRVLYGSMASRKRIKDAGGLPFELASFRDWLMVTLGGEEGVVKCSYCNLWLNIATIVPDHKIPLARGTNSVSIRILAGLVNLAPSCAVCNRRKGSTTAEGFIKLVEFMVANLEPADVSDIFSRLATGGEGAKMLWKRQSKGSNWKSKPKGGLF